MSNSTIVVSTVPEWRFNKYGVSWPESWDVRFEEYPISKEALNDAEFLLVDSMQIITSEMMDECPNLKVIHTEGVSFNLVDIDAAKERGIAVCNNRAVNKVAVAEHCIALMLAAIKKISLLDNEIRTLGYSAANSHFMEMGVDEVAGMTIGMVGMGAIGREVLKRLAGWDCRLCYYDPMRMPKAAEEEYSLEYMDLDNLMKASDVVTVHVPVIPSTIGMIGWDQISLMKKDAVLVNVSRGSIVVEDALVWALENSKIGCAALDTVDPEPMPDDHPYLMMSEQAKKRLILTTHSAGKTKGAFRRMLQWTIEDFKKAENGMMPNNIVNEVSELRV